MFVFWSHCDATVATFLLSFLSFSLPTSLSLYFFFVIKVTTAVAPMGDLEKQVEHREYSHSERPSTFMSATYEIGPNTHRDDHGSSNSSDPFGIERYSTSMSEVSTSSQASSNHLKRSLKSRHLAVSSLNFGSPSTNGQCIDDTLCR